MIYGRGSVVGAVVPDLQPAEIIVGTQRFTPRTPPSNAKQKPLNHRRSGPSFIHPISAINSPPTSSITPPTRSARSRGRCRRHGRCHDRRHGHHRSYPASNCTKSTALIVPRKSFAEGSVHDRFLRDSPQFHGAPHSFSLLAIRRRVRVPCARLCFAPCTHELQFSQRSRS